MITLSLILTMLSSSYADTAKSCQAIAESAYTATHSEDAFDATWHECRTFRGQDTWIGGPAADDTGYAPGETLESELGKVEPLATYLDSIGAFGATTLERALDEADRCGTPVSYAMRVRPGEQHWIAVCADDDGRPLSFRGAL